MKRNYANAWLKKHPEVNRENTTITIGERSKDMLCEAIDKKLEELEVRPLFYYNEHITTCLLLRNSTVLARGVSICSPKDQFSKKEGRIKATGRAIGALVNRNTYNKIKPSRFAFKEGYNNNDIIIAAEIFGVKSTYVPTLTSFEKELVGRANENKRKSQRTSK